ncbi:hypothetical protein [Chitinimonas lacunae]|uniref:Uncharacterized protein n=1 Tax=Chitinimonas lacunae TaxID=1963018 RepID=A0ABV8MJB6_9NEIS
MLLLSGCGQAVPAERAAYVGDWRSSGGAWQGQGDGMRLQIAADGRVEYQRREGKQLTTISAPLQGFSGNGFEVGIWGWTTTFVVSEAPHRVGPHWTMVVDGMRLDRAAE